MPTIRENHPQAKPRTLLFATLSYSGSGSWSGRVLALILAVLLSVPVIGIWYYGSNLVILMTQYSTRNLPPSPPPRPRRLVSQPSPKPGVVSVQILGDPKARH